MKEKVTCIHNFLSAGLITYNHNHLCSLFIQYGYYNININTLQMLWQQQSDSFHDMNCYQTISNL